MLITLAKTRGVNTDAGIRQDLARLYTLGELGRLNGLRLKAVKERGGDIPGMPNVAKLSMSQIVRLSRDLGLPKEPNNDRVTPFSELPKNA